MMMTYPSKACVDCGGTKTLGEFYVSRKMSDGHLNSCKNCRRSYQNTHYRRLMLDKNWRAKERLRKRNRAKAVTQSIKKPEQQKAHNDVANAIRDGRLVPVGRCEACGHDFSESRREAHHEDYLRPLDVAWLCSLCHGKRHRKES